MNLLGNPKTSMWLCRLVPAVTWVLWLVEILCRGNSHDTIDALFFGSIFVYVPLVFYVLPVLLFGGFLRGITRRKVGYFIFAGMTSGIGPVVWYFVSVDPVLRQMDKNQK